MKPLTLSRETAVELIVGDLIEQTADAWIVPFGDPEGTTSRVQQRIRSFAALGLQQQLKEQLSRQPGGKLAEGECLLTDAPGLKCEHLVHCHLMYATPGSEDAMIQLSKTLVKAFAHCRRLGVESVALPAIGTGIYGLSSREVAQASIRSALANQSESDRLARIRFVLNSSRTLTEFLVALSDFR